MKKAAFKAALVKDLIPQLMECHLAGVAKDAIDLVNLLDDKFEDEHQRLALYLETTLIPELKNDGLLAFASEFETGLRYLLEQYKR